MRRAACLTIGLFLSVAGPNPSFAADLKGKWSFGGSLSYLSTTDDIRSNAALFLGSAGADGIFGTGDAGETRTCFDVGAYCDPRPDDLLGRETAIEETVQLNVAAAFGMTRWLSLQLEAGYFRGDVGPIDVYEQQNFPLLTISGVQAGYRDRIIPTQAGQITEVPVSLNAVIRFRADSSVNPYFGFGAGRIFTGVNESPDVLALNSYLGSLRIRDMLDEYGDSVTPNVQASIRADGRVPLGQNAVNVDVEDVFEWHLTGGVEYFINDRASLVFDARYIFADPDKAFTISLGGQDQINFAILSPVLFRPDGSVRFFNSRGDPPNPSCLFSPNAHRFFDSVPPSLRVGCPIMEDPTPVTRVVCQPGLPGNYDGEPSPTGDPDVCYDLAIFNGSSPPAPWGDVVVQGGNIVLTGFAASIGFRIHF